MKRIIDHFLRSWKKNPDRKPLLIRGARQVGKTYAVRELGKTFPHFVEINLEANQAAREIFAKDLDVTRIVTELSNLIHQKIEPGATLLFIDEIQRVPQAITSLRYFYETIPNLHVVAAGSLLDFALEQVGAPVGRISFLYMYPLCFLEFLAALGYEKWIPLILSKEPVFEQVHHKLIDLVGLYLAVGGMPEAVNSWQKNHLFRDVKLIHGNLLLAYTQDFNTYARKHQIKYLSLVFSHATEQLSQKFMYSRMSDYRKREIEPAIELLEKAGIIYRVFRNSGQGIPLGAGIDLNDFKIIFLDVGLTQHLLDYDISAWLLKPLESFINKGAIVEAFVGQELLAYADSIDREKLYYWRNNESSAEIDYLIAQQETVVPIKVKSGKSTRIISMHRFFDTHPRSRYGLRFWTEEESTENNIRSYPLYAIAKPLIADNEYLKAAFAYVAESSTNP